MWAPHPYLEDFLDPAPSSDSQTEFSSPHAQHAHALRHARSRAAVSSSLLTVKLSSVFSSGMAANETVAAVTADAMTAAANVTAAPEDESCSGATYAEMVFYTDFSFYMDVVVQSAVGAVGFLANLIVVPILCG